MVSPNPKKSHGKDQLELRLLCHVTLGESFPYADPFLRHLRKEVEGGEG